MKPSVLITGRRKFVGRPFFLVLFALLLCAASPLGPFVGTARADLQGTDGFVRLSSPEIADPGTWSVGLFGNYYRRMSPTAHSVTENFAVGSLSGRFGITKVVEAFAAMPGKGSLWQYKRLPDRAESSEDHGGPGDGTLGVKIKAPLRSDFYALGLQVAAFLPTGKSTELVLPGETSSQKLFTTGSGSVSARLCASFDFNGVQVLSPLKVIVNASYWASPGKEVARFPSYLFSLPGKAGNNDVISGGLALVVPTPSVTLFTELYTEQFVQRSKEFAKKEAPIFMTPGAKVGLPFGLVATAAVDIRLSRDDKSTPFDPDETFPDWGITLGLDFTPTVFTEDMDEDGTPDRVDRCPIQPGPRSRDGCPDSLLMVQPAQRRPVQPAQMPPAQPAQTQPSQTSPEAAPTEAKPAPPAEVKPTPPAEVDSDNDGIPDSKDKCPTLAEDIDGFEDDDGCPEIDSDGDGVPDAIDKCPDIPGEKSNRGCPK